MGINILGEELEERTISRDYFTAIFNRSFNMIFVFDETNKIIDANRPAISVLNYTDSSDLKDDKIDIKSILNFHYKQQKNLFLEFLQEKQPERSYKFENQLIIEETSIPVSCICSFIEPINQFALIVKDISIEKQQERKIISSIIETQEKEQKRIAKELHDSVTQNLSGAKMLLSLIKKMKEEEDRNNLVHELTDILNESIQEIRDLSHNIMPPYLRYGLTESVTNLVQRLNTFSPFKVHLFITPNMEPIDHTIKASIYRIIQEFSNNTTKYAEAQNMDISINFENNKLDVQISDDGKGFEINHESLTKGIGWSNIISRIKAFSDVYHISSSPEQGTALFFTISL